MRDDIESYCAYCGEPFIDQLATCLCYGQNMLAPTCNVCEHGNVQHLCIDCKDAEIAKLRGAMERGSVYVYPCNECGKPTASHPPICDEGDNLPTCNDCVTVLAQKMTDAT